MWSGLGYYRRASNLLKGAKYVAEKHGGELPLDTKQLKEVPGIGDYTAGAISSIAGGRVAPLVDGNVVRVFSRMRRIGLPAKAPALAKACWRIAGDAVCPATPGDFNSGLMELGATICTPRSPSCGTCPMRAAGLCQAFDEASQLLREKGLPALQIAMEGPSTAGAEEMDVIDMEAGPEGSLLAPAGAAAASGSLPAGSNPAKTAAGMPKAPSKAVSTAGSGPTAAKGKAAQSSLLGFFASAKKAEVPTADATVVTLDSVEPPEAAVGGAGAAASSSSGSSAAPEAGFSAAELAAISRYIEVRWPAPAAKKAVPTMELTAVLPVRSNKAAPAASGGAGRSAAEAGAAAEDWLVWLSKGSLPAAAPPTKSKAASVAASAGAASAKLPASSGDSDVIEIVSDDADAAVAGGPLDSPAAPASGNGSAAASAVKRARASKATKAASAGDSASPAHVLAGALLKGQWQPLLLRTEALFEAASAAGSSSGGAGGSAAKSAKPAKRPRKASVKTGAKKKAGMDSDDDDERSGDSAGSDGDEAANQVAPRLDASSPRVVSAVTAALQAAGLLSTAAPLPVPIQHCGTVTHVFSHVIHRLQILRVDVDRLADVASPVLPSSDATGSESAAGAAAMPSSQVAHADDHHHDARWVRVSELPAVGVTTWAAKILYAALLGSRVADGSSGAPAALRAGKTSTKVEGPMGEGLQLLEKRWRLAHGKIE